MFGPVDRNHEENQIQSGLENNLSQDYEPSIFTVWGAWGKKTVLDDMPIGALSKMTRLKRADDWTSTAVPMSQVVDLAQEDNPMIDADAFNTMRYEGYTMEELGVKFEPEHRQKWHETQAEFAYNRMRTERLTKDMSGIAKLTVAAGVQILDPINFLPVAGPLSKVGRLGWLAGKGVLPGMARGAIENTVGGLITEPIVREGYLAEQQEYDLIEDGLVNVFAGAVFGAAIGGVGGALQSRMRGKVIDDIANDRPIDVSETIDEVIRAPYQPSAEEYAKVKSNRYQSDKFKRRAKEAQLDEFSVNTMHDIIEQLEMYDTAKSRTTRMGNFFKKFSDTTDTTNLNLLADAYNKFATTRMDKRIPKMIEDMMPLFIKIKGALDDPFVKRLSNMTSKTPEQITKDKTLMESLVKKYMDNYNNKAIELSDLEQHLFDDLEDFVLSIYNATSKLPSGQREVNPNKGNYFTNMVERRRLMGKGEQPNPKAELKRGVERQTGEREEFPDDTVATTNEPVEKYIITEDDRLYLRKRGWPDAIINDMTPKQAQRIMSSGTTYGDHNRLDIDEQLKQERIDERKEIERRAEEVATKDPEELRTAHTIDDYYRDNEGISKVDRDVADAQAKKEFMKQMDGTLRQVGEEINEIEARIGNEGKNSKLLREYRQAYNKQLTDEKRLVFRVRDLMVQMKNKEAAKAILLREFVGGGMVYSPSHIHTVVDRMYRAGYKSTDNITRIVDNMVTQLDYNFQQQYRQRAYQMLKLTRAEEYIHKYAQANDRSKAEALQALLTGNEWAIEGASKSVDAITKGKRAKFVGGFLGDLEEAKLMDTFRNPGKDLERNIAREMFKIDKDGKARGVTGDADAAAIAEIIHKWQKQMVRELNQNGGFIRWLNGYIVRQTHDPKRMRGEVNGRSIRNGDGDYQQAMNNWRNFIKERLDVKKTFDDDSMSDEQLNEVLEDVYKRLVSGKHMTGKVANKGLDDIQGTLADKISAHRKLHFKDADAWYEYNQEYGTKSLFDAVMNGFDKGAANVATMKVMGPDPDMVFNALMNRLEEAAGAGDTLTRKDLKAKFKMTGRRQLRNQYKEVTGETHMIDNQGIARWDANLRALKNMASLGSATISAISDAPLFTMAAKRLGIPITQSIKQFNSDLNFLSKQTKEVRNKVARSIGIGIDGMLGDFINRFSMDEKTIDTLITRSQKKFFKLTGLAAWTDAHKKGWAQMVSNHMTEMLEMDFKSLSKHKDYYDFADTLKRYGFTEEDWVKLQKTKPSELGDNKYLLPDDIEDENLSELYRTFLVDSADRAVITPGAKERSIMNQGTQVGTWSGTVMRMFSQFKSFPLTLQTRVVNGLMKRGRTEGRGISGTMDGLSKNWVPLFSMGVSMTVMGGIASSIKDITRGKEPRALAPLYGEGSWTQTLTLSATQGGAMGILGDMLVGTQRNYGGPAYQQAAGPVIGTMWEAASLAGRSVSGEGTSSAEWIWFVKNNIPYANHFAARGAIDMLLTYSILEAFNPGYLTEMERNYRQKTNTDYLITPSRYNSGRLIK